MNLAVLVTVLALVAATIIVKNNRVIYIAQGCPKCTFRQKLFSVSVIV